MTKTTIFVMLKFLLRPMHVQPPHLPFLFSPIIYYMPKSAQIGLSEDIGYNKPAIRKC